MANRSIRETQGKHSTTVNDSISTPKITDERKKEILAKILAEREKRRSYVHKQDEEGSFHVDSSIGNPTKPIVSVQESYPEVRSTTVGLERDLIVRRLLEERKKAHEINNTRVSNKNDELRNALSSASSNIRDKLAQRRQDINKTQTLAEESEEDEPLELTQKIVIPPTSTTKPDIEAIRKKYSDTLKDIIDVDEEPRQALSSSIQFRRTTSENRTPYNPQDSLIIKDNSSIKKRPSSAPTRDRSPIRTIKERTEEELEKQMEEKFTFKPTLARPSSAQKPRMGRIDILSKPKTEQYLKYEKLKQQHEASELKKCTYTPITNTPKGKSEVPVQDRLYREADNRLAVREKRRQHIESQELQKYTFKPKINNLYVDPGLYKPLPQRVGEVVRKKKEKLHNMWLEQQNTSDVTFKPAINPQKVADTNTTASNINERVKETIDNKLKKREEAMQEEMKKLTFAPSINANSEKIVNSIYHEGVNFWKRQKVYDIKREKALLKVEDTQAKECTFKPQVNETSEILVEVKQEREGRKETLREKYERLSKEDQRKKEEAQEKAHNNFYSQYKHKPEINPLSKTLVRSRSMDELSKEPSRKKAREEAEKAAEAAFKAACTFRPTINTPSGKRRDSISAKQSINRENPEVMLEKIEFHRQEREKRLELARKALERRQMEQCTFVPDIIAEKPKEPNAPILVRGLDRFLTLQDQAKKIEEEKKDRWEKAFKPKYTLPVHHQYTVPEPFQLSSPSEKQKSKEQKFKESLDREYTFQPKTNYLARRSLIESILADDSDLYY